MRAAVLLALLVAAAVAAGCTSPDAPGTGTGPTNLPSGGDGTSANNTTDQNTTAPPVQGVDVRVVDNSYEPSNLTVAPGTPITFTNVGQAMHTVTLRKVGDEGEIADHLLDAGQSATVQLQERGTYQLRCVYHSASYEVGPQIGTITVA